MHRTGDFGGFKNNSSKYSNDSYINVENQHHRNTKKDYHQQYAQDDQYRPDPISQQMYPDQYQDYDQNYGQHGGNSYGYRDLHHIPEKDFQKSTITVKSRMSDNKSDQQRSQMKSPKTQHQKHVQMHRQRQEYFHFQPDVMQNSSRHIRNKSDHSYYHSYNSYYLEEQKKKREKRKKFVDQTTQTKKDAQQQTDADLKEFYYINYNHNSQFNQIPLLPAGFEGFAEIPDQLRYRIPFANEDYQQYLYTMSYLQNGDQQKQDKDGTAQKGKAKDKNDKKQKNVNDIKSRTSQKQDPNINKSDLTRQSLMAKNEDQNKNGVPKYFTNQAFFGQKMNISNDKQYITHPLKPYYKKEFIDSFNSLYHQRFYDDFYHSSYGGWLGSGRVEEKQNYESAHTLARYQDYNIDFDNCMMQVPKKYLQA